MSAHQALHSGRFTLWRGSAPLPVLALLACIPAILGGCGAEPTIAVPEQYSAFIGTWEHGTPPGPEPESPHSYVFLTLKADGTLTYAWYQASQSGHACTVIGASSLIRIDDQRLEARVFWPITTRLPIQRGPHRQGGHWRMTVGELELQRISPRVERTAADFSCTDGTLVGPAPQPDGGPEGGTFI